MISNITRCDKLVRVRTHTGDTVEKRCVGYFTAARWTFLITEDVQYSGFFVITEASTGCNILDEFCYEDLQEVIRVGKQAVEKRRYYFSTKVKNLLVRTRQNLLPFNLSDLSLVTTLL